MQPFGHVSRVIATDSAASHLVALAMMAALAAAGAVAGVAGAMAATAAAAVAPRRAAGGAGGQDAGERDGYAGEEARSVTRMQTEDDEHGALAGGHLERLALLIGGDAARFGLQGEMARRLAPGGRAHWHGRCDFGYDHLRVSFQGCFVVVYCFTREATRFPRCNPLASCVWVALHA